MPGRFRAHPSRLLGQHLVSGLGEVLIKTQEAETEQLRSPSQAEGSWHMWSWPRAGFQQKAPLPLARNDCEHSGFMGVQLVQLHWTPRSEGPPIWFNALLSS